jgi:hypothetical protein
MERLDKQIEACVASVLTLFATVGSATAQA